VRLIEEIAEILGPKVMRVLLTGFGPFPGAPFNPSAVLAQRLARRRRPALAGVDRSVHVFATNYACVDRDLPKLLAEKPDLVLIFGLAGRRRHICIETHARNVVSLLFPDASGHRPSNGVIESAGPHALPGRAPFHALLAAARPSRVPVRLSRDAGRYLCNYVYWRALRQAPRGGPLVQFVHIPAVAGNPRPHRPGQTKRRPPSLAQVAAAVEMLLVALVAASKR
jgi:pyroglutamyl-peptidase